MSANFNISQSYGASAENAFGSALMLTALLAVSELQRCYELGAHCCSVVASIPREICG